MRIGKEGEEGRKGMKWCFLAPKPHLPHGVDVLTGDLHYRRLLLWVSRNPKHRSGGGSYFSGLKGLVSGGDGGGTKQADGPHLDVMWVTFNYGETRGISVIAPAPFFSAFWWNIRGRLRRPL